jgi:hypothetical protein
MDDPWLAELVRRVEAGETLVDAEDTIVDAADLEGDEIGEGELNRDDSRQYDSRENDRSEDGPSEGKASEEKIGALAEMICQAGDEPALALLVLMAVLESAEHPKAIANLTKHFVFTRCGELNLNGMIDAQIYALEHELFTQ